MLEFEWPAIFLLLPLPLLAYFLLPTAPREEAALRVPFYGELANLAWRPQTTAGGNRALLPWLIMLWLLCLGAAARPHWVGDPLRLPTSGRDLLLAVDLSGSMETADMVVNGRQVNRIAVTKAVVGDFVQRRENDRLGLILFGTRAYLQTPLTFDRETVNTLLQEARLGFAGEKTAIGDAIGLAVKRLRERPAENRILILLTDGANTAGALSPQQGAELAAEAGVTIYTIGLGADRMRVPGILRGGGSRVVNPSAEMDTQTLASVAQLTDGRFFRAKNAEDLARIYSELDQLEPVEQDPETYRPRNSLFHWPLTAALLLSAALALWRLRQNWAAHYIAEDSHARVS